MLSFLISRPIAVTFSFLGLVILSVLLSLDLPISLIPDTDTSEITVQVSVPHSSAPELEQSVMKVLRSQLMQVDHLGSLSSSTRAGSGSIGLTFDYEADSELVFLDVNEQIDQAMAFLPRSVERPRVLRSAPSDIPVLYLSVTPSNQSGKTQDVGLDFSEFMRSTIQRRLEQLETVAFADLSGYSQPEVQIRPRMGMIQRLGLSIDDISRILSSNNVDIGNFLIQDGQYQYNVRMLTAIKSVEDIEAIYFHHRGAVLRLSDIADVDIAPVQRVGAYVYDDRPGVLFTIRKNADARLLDLKKEVQVTISDFEKRYPEIDCHMTYDQSAILRVSIDNLGSALGYGSVFAILIMLLFYREWRAPLLIAVTIPIALMLALLGFRLFGITINVISLSGLILGVGLMIDNAIIVIDNIRQHLQSGEDLDPACIKGTNEVIRPLISSMFTTCAVFIPLVFLSGLAGALFYDQAVSISCALIASLAVTYFLLPVLFRLLHLSRKFADVNRTEERASFFERSVDGVLRFRWAFIVVLLIVAGCTISALTTLDRAVFPDMTRDGIEVNLDWGASISLEEAQGRVDHLYQRLTESDLLIASNSLIGTQDFLLEREVISKEEARLLLFGDDLDAIQKIVLDWKQTYPDVQLLVKPLSNIFDIVFDQNKAQLIGHIQSLQSDQLIKPDEIDYLYDFLRNRDISIAKPPRDTYIDVIIKDDVLAIYDIPRQRVQSALATVFNRHSAGVLRTSLRQIPITIASEHEDAMQAMKTTFVQGKNGGHYPLGALVETKHQDEYKIITADEGGLTLDIELPYYDTNLTSAISQLIRDQGAHTIRYSGQYFEDQEAVEDLSYVFVVVLLLLFFILSAQFESLILPLIIMLDVPVSLIGAFWALYWTGQSLNLVSMVGLIIASGIIVNDSILKVDMMQKARALGNSIMESIHIGGRRRLRPIIMTSLTTILAMVPILFSEGLGSELQYPLAIAIIGGLIFGTLMSLYFVPVLYRLLMETRH